jgi:hypothetical protein
VEARRPRPARGRCVNGGGTSSSRLRMSSPWWRDDLVTHSDVEPMEAGRPRPALGRSVGRSEAAYGTTRFGGRGPPRSGPTHDPYSAEAALGGGTSSSRARRLRRPFRGCPTARHASPDEDARDPGVWRWRSHAEVPGSEARSGRRRSRKGPWMEQRRIRPDRGRGEMRHHSRHRRPALPPRHHASTEGVTEARSYSRASTEGVTEARSYSRASTEGVTEARSYSRASTEGGKGSRS